MMILILGAVLLVATVALAACTSEGSWLIYFESLANQSVKSSEIHKKSACTIQRKAVGEMHPEADRIVAIPGQPYSRVGVLS